MNLFTPKAKLTVKEITLFALLGAIMFCGDIFLEVFPNIHLVGVLTVVYTIVFRVKALIPIYLYVFITLLLNGFGFWSLPYLYLWLILWIIVIILPKNMPVWLQWFVYPFVCMLHGLSFGILYAPAHAIMFGLNFEGIKAWIISGLGFDVLHAVGNLAGGLLIIPLASLLRTLKKQIKI
ncbi:MAG: hypothetical protein E7365_06490 [Clostridiales bacterium]|nr:hypothetical protein [Clostridiales bacterium]